METNAREIQAGSTLSKIVELQRSNVAEDYGKLVCLIDQNGNTISTRQTAPETGAYTFASPGSKCDTFKHHQTFRRFYVRIGDKANRVLFLHNDGLSALPYVEEGSEISYVQPIRFTMRELVGKEQKEPILIIGTQYPDSKIYADDVVSYMVLAPEDHQIREIELVVASNRKQLRFASNAINKLKTRQFKAQDIVEGKLSFGAIVKTPGRADGISNSAVFTYYGTKRPKTQPELVNQAAREQENKPIKIATVNKEFEDAETSEMHRCAVLVQKSLFPEHEFAGDELAVLCKNVDFRVNQVFFLQDSAYKVTEVLPNTLHRFKFLGTIDELSEKIEEEKKTTRNLTVKKPPLTPQPERVVKITPTEQAVENVDPEPKVVETAKVISPTLRDVKLSRETASWLRKGVPDYSVYFGYDNRHKVRYVGISKNPSKLFKDFENDPYKSFLKFGVAEKDLTLNQARALEQYYQFKHEQKNGGRVLTSNKLGGVYNTIDSDNRELIYPEALNWAKGYAEQ